VHGINLDAEAADDHGVIWMRPPREVRRSEGIALAGRTVAKQMGITTRS
jgi:hypothetical protein